MSYRPTYLPDPDRASSPDSSNSIGSWLIWLGLTAIYGIYCLATFGMVLGSSRNDVQATWIAGLLWAAGAFTIGYLYRRPRWIAGPLVLAVIPLLFGLFFAATDPRSSAGDLFSDVIFMQIAIGIMGLPMLLMTLFAAAGVALGRRRTARAIVPAQAADSTGAVGPSASAPSIPVEGATAPVPPQSRPVTPPTVTEADSRTLVEDILNTPMPRGLGEATGREQTGRP